MAINGYGKYWQYAIHDKLFRQNHATVPTSATTKYCLLSRASFNPDGTGIDEPAIDPVTTGYARVAIDDSGSPSSTSWSSTGDEGGEPFTTITTNAVPFEFNESTSSWLEIRSFGITFEQSATPLGNKIYFGGDLTTPKTIDADTVAIFTVGSIKLSTKNTGL